MQEFAQIINDPTATIIFFSLMIIFLFSMCLIFNKELEARKKEIIAIVEKNGYTGTKKKVLDFHDVHVGTFALVKIDNQLFYVQEGRNGFQVDRKVIKIAGTRGRIIYFSATLYFYNSATVITNKETRDMWHWG